MKIGLVGAGFIGNTHLEAYARIPEAEVVGVADARFKAAVAAARVSGSAPYKSYEEMVAREDVDVVDVCVPTSFHRELAIKAARDDKHVILEKPIARSKRPRLSSKLSLTTRSGSSSDTWFASFPNTCG
jgi:UDP-N-acetylglucosamine 3-dehydrogenase